MAAKKSEFVEYVVNDLLGNVSGITAKGMFGGYGLYKESFIFGIIVDEQLYFKVDESNQEKYETLSSKPFSYTTGRGKKKATMSYWLVPAEIMDDSPVLIEWMGESLDIQRSKKKTKGRSK